MSNPLAIFERSKAPHKRKKPFVHKAKAKKERLITIHNDLLTKTSSQPEESSKESIESKQSKESEESKQSKESEESKQSKESEESKQSKESEESKQSKESKKFKDLEDCRESKESKEPLQSKQSMESEESRDPSIQAKPRDKSPDFSLLDQILASDKPGEMAAASLVKPVSGQTAQRVLNPSEMSSLPGLLLAGEIDKTPGATSLKYASHSFPIPKSKAALKQKVLRHIDLIPKLLAGDEELSIFYTLAHSLRKQSRNATMSSQERWDIPWMQFVGGFYGLKRQSFISVLIQAKFGMLLKSSTNKTILFWSPDMFCTYVLANEIIMRIIMEDMNLSKLQAESTLQETADFGCHIADHIELKDDLDFDEFDVLAAPPLPLGPSGN